MKGLEMKNKRCEVCPHMSDRKKNCICRLENLIIPDVSTAPEWCPIKNVKRKE
jgi:hypothetical protein